MPGESPCPRCGVRLIDPECLALCPSCGWCRSLDETARLSGGTAPSAPRSSVLGIAEFLELLRKLPSWTWVLIGGIVVVGVFTCTAGRLLPPEGMHRALWTTGQIGLGIVVIGAAQAWALILFAPHHEQLGTKDMLLSGRLWSLTLKHLPITRWQVSLAVWGLTLIIAALCWIGGLSWWLPAGK